MEDLTRVAELEAKLEVLRVRFDQLRTVVDTEWRRLDPMVDDGDISEARENLKASLKI